MEKTRIRADIAGRIQEGLQRYRLAPGDQIEVMYHISLAPQAEDYDLGVNDEINVEFYYHPQLNRTLVIRPDGKVTLPIKGDFRAAGMKPPALARVIAQAYGDILQDPLVTVNVNKFSSHIAELQKAVTNSPRGQARLLTIAPDGKIYPPLLKSVRAAGRTADDVRDELFREYKRGFGNIDVSVLVESVAGNRIFVFGEVARPGPIPMSQPLTALQAIAYAGNVLPTGTLEKIKVLYWNENRQATVRTINLENVLLGARTEEDIVLPNNSVVYVPKTAIAKADQFVDQYIRQLLLWQGANLSFTYEVHKVPTPLSRY
ncbi:MAG: polysaccharide biosynthesis/export family protein [Pseudomonadota bacterium]|nr:polysaccharide biosynthesis/export family protein [Pseudomonadota bacterium]